jgi:hypothetical protein
MMENRAREKLYRDVVHCDIQLDPFAVAIIDSAEFQRLDGIKQLGFAYYAYRGAKSSRFEHSVGTYWLSRQLLRAILSNHERLGIPPPLDRLSESLTRDNLSPLEKLVAWGGLLHDIAHVPFGHTLEDEFSHLYMKHDDLVSPRITYLLYSEHSELAKVFQAKRRWLSFLSNEELRDLICLIIQYRDSLAGRELPVKSFVDLLKEARTKVESPEMKRMFPQTVRTLVLQHIERLTGAYQSFWDKGLFQPFMTDIVGNTICADILDYVKRDARGTGLQLSYDDRLLKYFIIAEEHALGQSYLRLALCVRDPTKGTIREDLIKGVFDVIGRRYDLVERVYYHKTKVAAGAMLGKALRTISQQLNPWQPRKAIPGEHEFVVLPPDSDPYEETGTEVESIISTRMTDDGLLRWLEDHCKKQSNESGSKKEAEQAFELVHALRARKLYKPCVCINIDSAQRFFGTTGVGEFVTRYREAPDSLDACKRLEKNIANKVGLEPHAVIVYCPEEKPQIKEIETRILLEGPRVETLKTGRLKEIYRQEIPLFDVKYQRLWKFYVFIHPVIFSDIEIRHRVVEAFCEEMAIDKKHCAEIAPFHFLTKDERERWIRYREWSKSQGELVLAHPYLDSCAQDSKAWHLLWDDPRLKQIQFEKRTEFLQVSFVLYLDEWPEATPRLREGVFKACNNPEWWISLLDGAQLSRRKASSQSIDNESYLRQTYFGVFERLRFERASQLELGISETKT